MLENPEGRRSIFPQHIRVRDGGERQRSTALRLLLSDTTDRAPVALTVAVDTCAATIEVQVVSDATIAGGRRPVVAARPAIAERAIVVAPAVDPQEGTGC